MSDSPEGTVRAPTIVGQDEPFAHGFFDADEASTRARRGYIRAVAGGTALIVLVIWGILSVYWGALWRGHTGEHNLHAWIVDFDGGEIGQSVMQTILATSGPKTSLSWEVVSASDFPNGARDLADRVLKEKVWAIVAINPNATSTLNAAIESADAAYNGSFAVTAYAVQARNENAYRDMIVPSITTPMQNVSLTFAARQAKQLANSTNLATLMATAPSVVLMPVYFTMDNVRPFDIPVATAVDYVGLIYLLIITFFAILSTNGPREALGLENRLTYKSYVGLRLAVPIIQYFFLSLAFSLLSKFFLVPFNREFGNGGFVLYWVLSWISMVALGLALESMLTILTARFVPFFFILWVMVNVSVCYYPIETLPTIYRYGYATPFYNISLAIRTIIFGTDNKVGQAFGVQFAWIAVSLVTLPFFVWIVRRRKIHQWNAKSGEKILAA